MKTKWFSIPILILVITLSSFGIGIGLYYGWKVFREFYWLIYFILRSGGIH